MEMWLRRQNSFVRILSWALVVVVLMAHDVSFAKGKSDDKAEKLVLPVVSLSPRYTLSLKAPKRRKGYRVETAYPALSEGTIFIGGVGHYFYGIDRASGKVKWSVDTQGAIEGSAATDGRYVYVGNNEGRLYALDIETGAKITILT